MKNLMCVFIILSAVCSVNAALETFNYSEDFESAVVGTLPSDWSSNGNGNWAVVNNSGSNRMRLINNESGLPILSYVGQVGGYDASNIVDFTTMQVTLRTDIWSDTTSMYPGIMARVQEDGSGYGVRVYGTSSGARLQLIYVDSAGGVLPLTQGGTFTAYNSDTDWFLKLSVLNDDVNQEIDITGRFMMYDGTNEKVQYFSIPYADAMALSNGTFGFIAKSNATSTATTGNGHMYDNVIVSGTVPEPATMIILGLGSLLMRRRK